VAKRSQWRAAAAWVRGNDGEVRQHLDTELQRLESADSFQALGVEYRADAKTIRAAFLTKTKEYHPNRFARRDRDLVRLANEVFVRVKKANNDLATDTARERSLAKLGRAATVSAAIPPEDPAPRSPAPAPETDPIDANDDFEETPATRPGAVRFKASPMAKAPKQRPVPRPSISASAIFGPTPGKPSRSSRSRNPRTSNTGLICTMHGVVSTPTWVGTRTLGPNIGGH
jgi:curved DNA-binding protein CbpA